MLEFAPPDAYQNDLHRLAILFMNGSGESSFAIKNREDHEVTVLMQERGSLPSDFNILDIKGISMLNRPIFIKSGGIVQFKALRDVADRCNGSIVLYGVHDRIPKSDVVLHARFRSEHPLTVKTVSATMALRRNGSTGSNMSFGRRTSMTPSSPSMSIPLRESVLSQSPDSTSFMDASAFPQSLPTSSSSGFTRRPRDLPEDAILFQQQVQKLPNEPSKVQMHSVVYQFRQFQQSMLAAMDQQHQQVLEHIQKVDQRTEQRFAQVTRTIQDGGIPNYISMKVDKKLTARRAIADVYKFTFACDGFGSDTAPHVEREHLMDYSFTENYKKISQLAPFISVGTVAISATLAHFSNSVQPADYDRVKKELKNVSQLSPLLVNTIQEARQHGDGRLDYDDGAAQQSGATSPTGSGSQSRRNSSTSKFSFAKFGRLSSTNSSGSTTSAKDGLLIATTVAGVGSPSALTTDSPIRISPPSSPSPSPISEWTAPKFIDMQERIQIKDFYDYVRDKANRGDFKGSLAGLFTVSNEEWQKLGGNRYTEVARGRHIDWDDDYNQTNEPKGHEPTSRSLCSTCLEKFKAAKEAEATRARRSTERRLLQSSPEDMYRSNRGRQHLESVFDDPEDLT